MDIKNFHLYNRLVRRELVEPLKCECGFEYTVRADEEGSPLLQCFGCNSLTTPGVRMYDRVVAIVKEFY